MSDLWALSGQASHILQVDCQLAYRSGVQGADVVCWIMGGNL